MPAQYIEKVIYEFKTGKTTEHSFRGLLKDFVERCVMGVQAINEPKRITCGAPDYIIQKKNIPVGYIEAKDIIKNLDRLDDREIEQKKRYLKSLDNLIYTNYLDFRFFVNGEEVKRIEIGKIVGNQIQANPKEFENLVNHIRNFCDYQGQTIKSAKQLAEMMAQKAVLMRDVLEKAVTQADEENSLRQQMEAFKLVLLHDLDEKTFADIYSQTITYGLFVARLNDKTLEDFSRQEARELVSKTNPFLRSLFDYISGANLDDRIVWIVDDLVEIFRATDLNKLLKNFGTSTNRKDPFLHFYETFLDKYDKENREKRGVYYTPQSVVKFIVRAVDDILKQDFNLPQGLADTSKIKHKRFLQDYYDKKKKKVTQLWQDEELFKVQILDPATGTGTFLSEVITKIYERFVNQQGVWNQYVDENLIPRLHGFEILMTPYVMCHLKLETQLQETGYTPTEKTNRFNVYLTNTLEKDDSQQYPLFASWLADEAKMAKTIKNDTPIMVVIGNPPYSVSSCNKNDYIDSLMQEYKKDLNERNIQSLSDDYIKFIRMGESYIEKNGEGVLAYISNNSFLDGLIHRQMRKHLLETFDKIYIIDLHGNSKKKETCPDGSKDENVFNIMQGVSINIFIKTGQKNKDELAKVYHKDLCGIKQSKYDYLDVNTLETVDFKELDFDKENYFFVPKDFNDKKEYDSGLEINELFVKNSNGIKTHRDSFVVDIDKNELEQRLDDFFNCSKQEIINKYLLKETHDFIIDKVHQKSTFSKDFVQKICYRPFDFRHIYYDTNFIDRPRFEMMKNFINKDNIGLAIKRQCKQQFSYVFVHNDISEACLFESAYANNIAIPLYLYPEAGQQSLLEAQPTRTPNLNMDIVKELEQEIGLTFTPEKEETPNTFAPIDILDYIYGVLHSNKYREKFKEFLKIDFPKIPYPSSADYFFKIGALGKQIREIHLLESPIVNELVTSYPIAGNNEVEKPEYKDNKVYISRTQYFDNVPQEAWEFYIGGYQPAQKWLKDRKGRILSYDDLMHYQKIIVALTATHRLMQQIDEVVEA